MMHENMRHNRITLHGKFEKGAVFKLDAYIKKHDRRLGKVSSLKILSQGQLELLNLMHELIQAIEKEELDKQQAFQLLKASNEAIRTTISTFQDSMRMYKENIRSEFAKFDCLSTNRLLNIGNSIISTIYCGSSARH